MQIKVINYKDYWQEVKDAALTTIKKESTVYPSKIWKRRILLAEHSVIRKIKLNIKVYDIPYWIAMHFVRHKIGIEHFISTQRTDRTNVDRTKLSQDNLVDWEFEANAQAFINISRKRLCNKAAKETREIWQNILQKIYEYEPELFSVCKRECEYRGFCPEFESCGYYK
jgi:hypothetical protein